MNKSQLFMTDLAIGPLQGEMEVGRSANVGGKQVFYDKCHMQRKSSMLKIQSKPRRANRVLVTGASHCGTGLWGVREKQKLK